MRIFSHIEDEVDLQILQPVVLSEKLCKIQHHIVNGICTVFVLPVIVVAKYKYLKVGRLENCRPLVFVELLA